MAKLNDMQVFERQHFFNGQRLFAPDLQEMEANNRQLRWLHNRSLHQPGIGNGFAPSGNKEDRQIEIGPGYAIDCYGREIILSKLHMEPVPPVASEENGDPVFYDLTISYPEDSDIEETETREGICLPRGVVRLREEPVFCWVRLEKDLEENLHAKDGNLRKDIEEGKKIILARAQVLNCQLEQPLSVIQRRSAKPARQPYIACDSVRPAWRIWEFDETNPAPTSVNISANPSILPYGLQATITSSAARFVTSPHYSANILGPRIRSIAGPPGTQEVPTIIDGRINIEDVNSKGFTIKVLLLAQVLAGTADIQKDESQFSDWKVVWMGVER